MYLLAFEYFNPGDGAVVKSLKRSSSKHKFKIMVGGGAVTEQLAKNMEQMPIQRTVLRLWKL